MAESRSKPKATEAVEAEEAVEAPPEDSYPVERLTTEPGFLPEYPPHVIAGALAGANRKNMTLDEARAAVKKWLDSEVAEPKEA